ncbi:MAG: hypothetical protein GY935_04950 [Gammaproteobacteria bacterium]|nr:hypothetical protein [Gammaproteobacteria bacterium]
MTGIKKGAFTLCLIPLAWCEIPDSCWRNFRDDRYKKRAFALGLIPLAWREIPDSCWRNFRDASIKKGLSPFA